MKAPEIIQTETKTLIGMRLSMRLAEDRTPELWRSFMPRRKEIQGVVSEALFSLQVYPASFNFQQPDPTLPFEKWAAVEVSAFENIPEGMELFELPAGKYAVFLHRGGPARARESFAFIFTTWLPQSGYTLAPRPHFEKLDDRYKHNEPDSEEELWIPIH